MSAYQEGVPLRYDLRKRMDGHKPASHRCNGSSYDVLFGPRVPMIIVLEPDGSRIAMRCAACGGEPARALAEGIPDLSACPPCNDVGFIGIDPTLPNLSPDSVTRTAVMRARYVAGLPLRNDCDRNGSDFMKGMDDGTAGVREI